MGSWKACACSPARRPRARRGPRHPSRGGAGSFVILLSDGRASDGIRPLEAAQQARDRGVRVYTVGMGTAGDPTQFRSGYWGVLDEPTLRAMADETGGQYFHAGSAGRLREGYRALPRTFGSTPEPPHLSGPTAHA